MRLTKTNYEYVSVDVYCSYRSVSSVFNNEVYSYWNFIAIILGFTVLYSRSGGVVFLLRRKITLFFVLTVCIHKIN